MKKKLNLRLLPSEAYDNRIIQQYIASSEAISTTSINGFNIIKRSIDARSRTIYYNLSIEAFINEPFQQRKKAVIHFPDVHHAKEQVIIIGAGPAGLFAALQLLEKGIKPIIVERGKDVRSRRRDLAILNKEGLINPESNYCFGEGGAGTYSDGKLYTRSNKRGSVDRILNLFVQFGADENILVDAHPHIGTNKLPHIITAMREGIIMHGGEVRFEAKMTDLIIDKDSVTGIVINHHEKLYGNAV
ncbi:MAG: FAD-binding protein, partial [Chitinophagaceae bacterium]|nr:FAD-binding protein [Chitinophagaceae bacterium]